MMARLLFLGLVSLLSTVSAWASHSLGGDLTYQYVGPGAPYTGGSYVNAPTQRYRVLLTSYRDCGGVALETAYPLVVNDFACGGLGTTITATLSRVGATTYGSAYCAAAGSTTCQSSLSSYSNYEIGKYETPIDLPTAPLWRLSVTYGTRPNLRNLTGQSSMYWEATLHNNIQVGGVGTPISNNSPRFSAEPVSTVPYFQRTFVHLGAFDADGDSLSFSLVGSLSACNSPVAYTWSANPSGFPIDTVINGVPSPCVVFPNNYPAYFSATYPLPSYTISGPCLAKTLTPYFSFNSGNGNLTFTPSYYTGSHPESAGKNKYAVAVQVQEWRRVGGSYRLVGTARRDVVLIIYDGGLNRIPTIDSNVLVGAQFLPLTQIIPAPRGQTTSVLVQASGANAGQVLTMSGNATGVAGATVTTVSPNVAQVSFTPPASLPDGTYYVTVTATDNACPVKGYTTRTVAFRVNSGALAAKSSGNRRLVSAYPNPFTEQVQFTLPRPTGSAEAVLILDQFGRVVERLAVPAGATGTEAAVTWRPATTLPTGVYLARFANGRQTVRLLRTRP